MLLNKTHHPLLFGIFYVYYANENKTENEKYNYVVHKNPQNLTHYVEVFLNSP